MALVCHSGDGTSSLAHALLTRAGAVTRVAELEHKIANEMLDGIELPVLLESAGATVGLDHLADHICELGPSLPEVELKQQTGTGTGTMLIGWRRQACGPTTPVDLVPRGGCSGTRVPGVDLV